MSSIVVKCEFENIWYILCEVDNVLHKEIERSNVSIGWEFQLGKIY